mmetsp:Transcript_12775/g.34834  ORF Transcript_12775/g.34834 Transcript_12775/m.34834 type:complete len:297 (-) Transcript_12775:213-1103(-)
MPTGQGSRGASGRTTMARQTSSRKEGEESIYNIGGVTAGYPPAAPKIKTYNIAPQPSGSAVSPTGKTRMHADSSQIQQLLNPVQGPRDAQTRQGIKPMDHARSNAHAVKEASQLNALRKAAAEAAQQNARPPGYIPAYNRTSSAGPSRPPALGAKQPSANSRNFMQENKLGAAAAIRAAKPKEDEMKYLKKQDYGRVPSYLLERKIELAAQQEAEERMKEAALIPPGMRLLPDEERLETLAILAKNKQDVERAIQALPLRIETPSAIRRKEDLERRLSEIEDATKIFQRPKVLVHL